MWQDFTIISAEEAERRDLSTGLEDPKGLGQRLIVLHIGNEEGFVDGGSLVFESHRSADYHQDMNHQIFEKWFVEILGVLPLNSVIIMDNASYHSRQSEKIPNTNSRKGEILKWMEDKSIPILPGRVTIKQLLTIVKDSKPEKSFICDELAKDAGHTVLRLPPYHCELNPIELIWANMKNYVSANNAVYTLKNLKRLLEAATAQITVDNWRDAVRHVVCTVEPHMIQVDNMHVDDEGEESDPLLSDESADIADPIPRYIIPIPPPDPNQLIDEYNDDNDDDVRGLCIIGVDSTSVDNFLAISATKSTIIYHLPSPILLFSFYLSTSCSYFHTCDSLICWFDFLFFFSFNVERIIFLIFLSQDPSNFKLVFVSIFLSFLPSCREVKLCYYYFNLMYLPELKKFVNFMSFSIISFILFQDYILHS